VPHKLTLWPQGDGWRKWLDEYGQWVAAHHQPDNSQALLESRMLSDMATWYATNKPVLDKIQWAMAVSFIGVVLQLIFWTLAAFIH
jgi:hypothetical protein